MPLLKPTECKGCPFYDKGQYYVPDTVVPGSQVYLIAQNPGPDEEAGLEMLGRHWLGGKQFNETKQVTPQPLIGATGQLLNREFLPLSGLKRSEVSLGNAIRCRPGKALGLKADELPTITAKMSLETSKTDIVRALKHCADAHLHIPKSVKVVVAMGSVALFQLTGHNDGSNWRGYVIRTTRSSMVSHLVRDCNKYHDTSKHLQGDEIDIFSTMHIAALYKGDNKRYWHSILRDFHKLGRFLKGEWPLPLPRWSDKPPTTWPKISSFDTEYNPERNNELIRWSLCDSNNNLYCVERDSNSSQLLSVKKNSTVIIQNALADIIHLSNIIPMGDVTVEDLMLAHATLYTGEPHGLNHINSIYGAFNRYKHLIDAEGSAQLYSSLDAYEPMHEWRYGILPEFKKDVQSYKVYKNYMLPLIPIIDEAQQKGARLNGQRLREVQEIYQQRIDIIKMETKELINDSKFNIGGRKQLLSLLYSDGELGNLQQDTLRKLQLKHDPSSLEYKLISYRLEYSEKAKLLSNYVNKLVDLDRIYPTHLPTQSSFRWSTIGPPLTNFPRECIALECPEYEHEWGEQCWSVRDIVLPDDDEVLVTWDHDDAEGRIYALRLDDQEDLEAYRQGYDLHTITACNLFNMALPIDLRNPHSSRADAEWRRENKWQGKDTQRRVMAKGFKHGSKYSVSYKFVRSIKNIDKYDRTMDELEDMAKAFLKVKAKTFDKKIKVMNEIKKAKVARNLYGAKRQFYDSSEATGKDGFSFMISSTVSLYNNITLILMKQRFPSCRLIHNAHDGDKMCFPRDEVPSIAELKDVIERSVSWEDREVILTAGVKVYK
jgi:uracil-DNA glycosylase